jgi:hypothetical protein
MRSAFQQLHNGFVGSARNIAFCQLGSGVGADIRLGKVVVVPDAIHFDRSTKFRAQLWATIASIIAPSTASHTIQRE